MSKYCCLEYTIFNIYFGTNSTLQVVLFVKAIKQNYTLIKSTPTHDVQSETYLSSNDCLELSKGKPRGIHYSSGS